MMVALKVVDNLHTSGGSLIKTRAVLLDCETVPGETNRNGDPLTISSGAYEVRADIKCQVIWLLVENLSKHSLLASWPM